MQKMHSVLLMGIHETLLKKFWN